MEKCDLFQNLGLCIALMIEGADEVHLCDCKHSCQNGSSISPSSTLFAAQETAGDQRKYDEVNEMWPKDPRQSVVEIVL